MHDIVGRAWPNMCAEHGTVTCVWLSSECDWTSGHRKSHKIYTHVHRNCESGVVITYKHAAHRLVQHRLQVKEMARTDDSTLAIFLYMRYREPPSRCSLESSDQHRHRESGNQDKPHWQIAMQLRYHSSLWIGPWVVSGYVTAIEELDCPWFMSSTIEWFLNLTYDVNHAK